MVKCSLSLLVIVLIPQVAFAQNSGVNTVIERLKAPVYGRNCGYAGIDPEDRTRIEKLINFKDTLAIFPWLDDEDTALQAYGAEAVLRLENNGMIMPPRIAKKVAQLRRSRKKVNYCGGCSHWEMSMREALDDLAPRPSR